MPFGGLTTDEGLDVSAIAKQYGGGGHKNASGFRLSYADAAKLEGEPRGDVEGVK